MPTTPAALPAFFMPTADDKPADNTPKHLFPRRQPSDALPLPHHTPLSRGFYPLPRPTLPDHFGAITVIVECENDSSAYGLVK